jgi:hypothetical protein
VEEQARQSTRFANADGRAQRFAALTTAVLIEARDSYIIDSETEDVAKIRSVANDKCV